MPLFEVKHGVGAATLGASMKNAMDLTSQLEAREQDVRLQQARIDAATEQAAQYAETQKLNRDLRRQELDASRQSALYKHEERMQALANEQAEVFQDERVSRAAGFLARSGQDDVLANMRPDDPGFWALVDSANLDADLEESMEKAQRSMQINQALEKDGLLPEGTSAQVMEAILRGDGDPDAILEDARKQMQEQGRRNSQAKAAMRLVEGYREVLGSELFKKEQDEETLAEVEYLLDDIEWLATYDPSSEQVSEIRREIRSKLAPAEVKEERDRLRAENEAMAAQLAEMERAQSIGMRAGAEAMKGALAVRPESQRKKATDLRKREVIQFSEDFTAWLQENNPLAKFNTSDEAKEAIEAKARQLGVEGGAEEIQAVMEQAERLKAERGLPGNFFVVDEPESFSMTGRYKP